MLNFLNGKLLKLPRVFTKFPMTIFTQNDEEVCSNLKNQPK